MAKRSLKSLDADFADVVAFFKERGVISEQASVQLIATARRIHAVTYSLILWRFRLGGLPEHGQVFIEEIASDALQVLPQATLGYGKTTKLLVRGLIENTLRHVYFIDHPIEFARMNREAKWYLSMDDLEQYPRIHPSFLNVESQFDAFNKMKSLYSELSAGVHGRRVQDLEMRIALNRIQFDQTAYDAHAKLVERCGEVVNFILGVLHHVQLRRLPAEDRRVILRTLSSKARRVWNDLG